MTDREPARSAARRTRWTILGILAIAGAALAGVLACGSPEPSSSSATASAPEPSASSATPGSPPSSRGDGERPAGAPGGRAGRLGAADGVVPDGVTVFDDVPAVSKLDPALLAALRKAATDAKGENVQFYVNSGWRSAAYQNQLLQEAVAQYGSEAEAAKWVATATTSQHVTGHAADIGHAEADSWLSEHGAAYGLCQIYRNEPWHYELRPDAAGHGCPAMYADPTQDPRMRG